MTFRIILAFVSFFVIANAAEHLQSPTIQSTYIGIENTECVQLQFTDEQDVIEMPCDDPIVKTAEKELNEFLESFYEPIIFPYCTVDASAFGAIVCTGEIDDQDPSVWDFLTDDVCLNKSDVEIGDVCIPMLQ